MKSINTIRLTAALCSLLLLMQIFPSHICFNIFDISSQKQFGNTGRVEDMDFSFGSREDYNFTFVLSPSYDITQNQIRPGEGSSTITFFLTNTGQKNDNYTVSIANPPWPITCYSYDELYNVTPNDERPIVIKILSTPTDLLNMTYWVTIRCTSNTTSQYRDAQVPIAIKQVVGFSVGSVESKNGSRGSDVYYNLTITNLGNGRDRFNITLEPYYLDPKYINWTFSLPGGNITPEGGPGENVTVQVMQHVPETGSISETPENKIKVIVKSVSDPSVQASVVYIVTKMLPFHSIDIQCPNNVRIYPSGNANIAVNLTNLGNVEEHLTVALEHENGESWLTTVTPSTVDIQYGAFHGVNVFIQPPSNSLAGFYNFRLNVTLGDGSFMLFNFTAEVIAKYMIETRVLPNSNMTTVPLGGVATFTFNI
ncbi:MAG: hypothetical protein QW728_03525, partial [Thermoplasmata archaeon]